MYENPPKPSAPPAEEVLSSFDHVLQSLVLFKNGLTAFGKFCLYATVVAFIFFLVVSNVLIAIIVGKTMCISGNWVSQWDQCPAISDVSLGNVYLDGNMISKTFDTIFIQSLTFWYNDLDGREICNKFCPKVK